MRFHTLVACFLVIYCSSIIALDFSGSSWIWTNELPPGVDANAPPGTRAFRYDFLTPQGKTPLLANIILTADNSYTLWVNGAQVGTGADFQQAQGYCVILSPFCHNAFAIAANNEDIGPNPAGLLVAIQIMYTDGSSDTIVSDSNWKALNSANIPAGFEQDSFDVSEWPLAIVEGPFGIGPWGNVTIMPPPQAASNLTLATSKWIWTNESIKTIAPVGTRAFRKTFSLPNGQNAVGVKVIVAADDDFTLWVQGVVAGTKAGAYTKATHISTSFDPTSQVTIAVVVSNLGGPAGLITAVELDYAECLCQGPCPVYNTDSSWKYSLRADPSNNSSMYQPGFDDSAWPNAVEEGAYGMAPWGSFPM